MALTFQDDMEERKRLLPQALGLDSPAGVLTQNVKPGRASALPNSVDHYRQRAAEMYRQGSEMFNAEPDMSQMQEFAKQRGAQGQAAMLNALAAQFAGESFQPVQAQFLKRAAAAQDPMKVAGGILTPEGQFLKDPVAAQEKKAEFLLQQARQYEALAQSAETAQQRAEAQRLAQESLQAWRQSQEQMRLLHLGILQQGVNQRADAAQRAKTLPFNAVQDLSKQAGGAESLIGLAESFDPKYASSMPGVPGLGEVQNALGRAGVGNQDRANWWQNYNEQANRIRHELFGSALTANEKAAFDAAMISPNMDATVIQRRLDQQAAAAQRAYTKILESAKGSGYNTEGLPSVRNYTPRAGNTAPGAGAKGGNAPAGIDPKVWNAMTPEEKKLWN